MEVWKEIPGFLYPYQVSTTGIVKVLAKRVIDLRGFVWNHPERIMKPKANKHGYLHVNLFVSTGKSKTVDVHRIVATAFLENDINKREVNHINGNKADNRIENLEWVSSKENKAHGFSTGLYKRQNQGMGKKKQYELLRKTGSL